MILECPDCQLCPPQDPYEEAVDLTKPGAFVPPPPPRVDPATQRKLREMERQLKVTQTLTLSPTWTLAVTSTPTPAEGDRSQSSTQLVRHR